jgi:hypothetical protein
MDSISYLCVDVLLIIAKDLDWFDSFNLALTNTFFLDNILEGKIVSLREGHNNDQQKQLEKRGVLLHTYGCIYPNTIYLTHMPVSLNTADINEQIQRLHLTNYDESYTQRLKGLSFDCIILDQLYGYFNTCYVPRTKCLVLINLMRRKDFDKISLEDLDYLEEVFIFDRFIYQKDNTLLTRLFNDPRIKVVVYTHDRPKCPFTQYIPSKYFSYELRVYNKVQQPVLKVSLFENAYSNGISNVELFEEEKFF